ncbi:hypothetical protein CHU98_g9300 [Xylaria longipes]|nr:hypothetical protein CHU98_g9300 [Xylaria longipes]
MLRGLFFAGAVTVAVLALIASQWTPPTAPLITDIRQGRNNTVLFLTNSEHGLANVLVATAYTLLERHPEVQVHYASFPSMARKLERISERAPPEAAVSTRHCLPRTPRPLFHFDHDIIDEVDPSLVVLDPTLRPAIHAARNSSRLHAFISPLTPIESFPLEQPYFGWLWKYPVMGSGIPYPVPWSQFLENIYINLQYFYAMLRMSGFTDVKKYIASKGLIDSVNWFNIRNDDVPFFSQALPGASIPVEVIPQNVTLTGPIILSVSRAEEEAPALAEWLARAPTMLISFGSLFLWTEYHATIMAQAIADTLAWRPDLQVLWKFMKVPYDAEGRTYGDEFMAPLHPYLENGRLKMESWLEVQPVSLLETGHIVASVHHGGAGCYSEALGTGIPQIILPLWLDHYSFAQLAQTAGIGIWGCPDASPWWTAACLRDAFITVLGGESGDAIRSKAKYFGDIAQRDPGQNVVAREIAKLAGSGYSS